MHDTKALALGSEALINLLLGYDVVRPTCRTQARGPDVMMADV